MRRKARFNQSIELELEDGTSLQVGPGVCWVSDEDAAGVTLLVERAGSQRAARVRSETFLRLLQQHDLVYAASWWGVRQ